MASSARVSRLSVSCDYDLINQPKLIFINVILQIHLTYDLKGDALELNSFVVISGLFMVTKILNVSL